MDIIKPGLDIIKTNDIDKLLKEGMKGGKGKKQKGGIGKEQMFALTVIMVMFLMTIKCGFAIIDENNNPACNKDPICILDGEEPNWRTDVRTLLLNAPTVPLKKDRTWSEYFAGTTMKQLEDAYETNMKQYQEDKDFWNWSNKARAVEDLRERTNKDLTIKTASDKASADKAYAETLKLGADEAREDRAYSRYQAEQNAKLMQENGQLKGMIWGFAIAGGIYLMLQMKTNPAVREIGNGNSQARQEIRNDEDNEPYQYNPLTFGGRSRNRGTKKYTNKKKRLTRRHKK